MFLARNGSLKSVKASLQSDLCLHPRGVYRTATVLATTNASSSSRPESAAPPRHFAKESYKLSPRSFGKLSAAERKRVLREEAKSRRLKALSVAAEARAKARTVGASAKTRTGSEHMSMKPGDQPVEAPNYLSIATGTSVASEDKYTRTVQGFLRTTFGLAAMKDLVPPTEQKPIARLAHGLERVIFNPGVYWLQDPRSSVYNFTPWLQTVPKVEEFAFSRVAQFIKSSADDDLSTLAKQRGAKYTGSTSSLTGMLTQIYLLLSEERPVNLDTLSSAFANEDVNFTYSQKLPVSTKLYYHNGHYSTDSYSRMPGLTDKIVLTWMGTMLEKFLTLPEQDFKNLLHSTEPQEVEEDHRREAFRYVQHGNYIMRSQLDCYDPRLAGSGVFDIKTRAAMPIRMDIMNYEENSGYQIQKQHGYIESFEREYYDLIRSAFLKYSFQARIGNMDGMFIAYHNTARIFGFQYISVEEMDERLFGNKHAGPFVFSKCVELLQAINDEITHHFPEQSTACLWETRPEEGVLSVWVEPADWVGFGEKPMIELQVRAKSFIDGRQIPAAEFADNLPHSTWTVRYTIGTSADEKHIIRERHRVAEAKLSQYFNLPSGVTVSEMAEVWQRMDFGGNSPEVPFRPEMFKNPPRNVRAFRKLARRGREFVRELQEQRKGQEVVVLGEEKKK